MLESFVRASLWFSAPLNLAVAWLLVMPGAWPGRLVGLPADVHPLYAGLSALLVALFGCAYLWLALCRRLDPPMLCLGASGKAGVFLLVTALWMGGALPVPLVVAASLDLGLAILWFSWIMAEPRGW